MELRGPLAASCVSPFRGAGRWAFALGAWAHIRLSVPALSLLRTRRYVPAADGPPAQIRDSASKRWCRDDPAYMNATHQRHDSGDEGNRTASTDTSGSDREPLDEDAASLASIMMSIASSCGKRPFQSQPSSAETVRATNMSASSSVTNDDEDEDEGPADSVQIKKQRRREKNRASAQQSRQRKKHHLETLETRVEELERERAALLARVEGLCAENRRLRGCAAAAAGHAGMSADPSTTSAVAAASQKRTDEVAIGAGLLDQLAQAAESVAPLA